MTLFALLAVFIAPCASFALGVCAGRYTAQQKGSEL